MSPPRQKSSSTKCGDNAVDAASAVTGETATTHPSPATSVQGFETALKELEDIVARMERGDLPLEESLTLFERGMALTGECRQALDTAELRVRNLLDRGASVPDEDDDVDPE